MIYLTTTAALFAAILITGCGGGSSTSSAFTVTITTDAEWIAFETAANEWTSELKVKETLADGKKVYTAEAGSDGHYGVALYCNRYLTLFQMTRQESDAVNFSCAQNRSGRSLTIDINSSVDTPDTYAVAADGRYDYIVGNSGSLTLKNLPDPAVDLVVTSIINYEPSHFYIQHDIDLNHTSMPIKIEMNDDNAHRIASYGFTQAASTQGDAYLLTKNMALFLSRLHGSWYYPSGGLMQGDNYLFYAENTYGNITRMRIEPALSVAQEDITVDVSDITPLSGTTFTGDTFGGLDYTPSPQSQPLSAYVLKSENDDDENRTTQGYVYFVSKGWLGDETTYRRPDLSGVDGYKSEWNWTPSDSVDVEAEVIMSNTSLREMLQAQKYISYEFNHHDSVPLIPGLIFETAKN